MGSFGTQCKPSGCRCRRGTDSSGTGEHAFKVEEIEVKSCRLDEENGKHMGIINEHRIENINTEVKTKE